MSEYTDKDMVKSLVRAIELLTEENKELRQELREMRYDIEGLFFPNYETISDSDKNELMVLSHKLLESADSAVIGEITKLISKYSRTSYKEITDRYVEIKSNRLEVK